MTGKPSFFARKGRHQLQGGVAVPAQQTAHQGGRFKEKGFPVRFRKMHSLHFQIGYSRIEIALWQINNVVYQFYFNASATKKRNQKHNQ